MKLLRWLITLPLALILIVFAVSNRNLAEVSLWPLDFSVSWPLFVFVYIGVIAGFVTGAVIAWVSAAQRHRRAQQRRRDRDAQTRHAAHGQDRPATGSGATPPAVIN